MSQVPSEAGAHQAKQRLERRLVGWLAAHLVLAEASVRITQATWLLFDLGAAYGGLCDAFATVRRSVTPSLPPPPSPSWTYPRRVEVTGEGIRTRRGGPSWATRSRARSSCHRVLEDLPLDDATHSGVIGSLAQRCGKLGGALRPVGHPRAAAFHLDVEQPLVHIGVPERVVGHTTQDRGRVGQERHPDGEQLTVDAVPVKGVLEPSGLEILAGQKAVRLDRPLQLLARRRIKRVHDR